MLPFPNTSQIVMLLWERQAQASWGPELALGPSKLRTWGSHKHSCEQHKCSCKVQNMSRDKLQEGRGVPRGDSSRVLLWPLKSELVQGRGH